MRLTELKGDLFCGSESSSPPAGLAHCVSADLKMGRGIAAEFRSRFGRINEFHSQGCGVGEVAFVRLNDGRLLACLVTKQRYWEKPTYDSLAQCLQRLRQICLDEGVQRLAVPRLGCGLDRLDWRRVKQLIESAFDGTDICIDVYSL